MSDAISKSSGFLFVAETEASGPEDRLLSVQLHQREARLWRRVIDQAVYDATATIPPEGKTYKSRKTSRAAARSQDSARRWLITPSKDFRTVCHFAGFDPDQVRAAAKRLEAKGWKT